MEARNRRVKDWLARVRTRQIALPRFQRLEAWGPRLVADVLRNILRDLPIGSTLVLEVGGELPFVSREIVTAPSDGETISELLLDGQQRLTAIWRSLNDTYPEHTYFVYLPLASEEEDQPDVYWETRWARNGRRYPLWVDAPRECWERRSIPIRLLNPDDELEYKDWAKEASDGDKDVEIELRDLISSLRSKVASFQLPFLYLEPSTPKDVAIEVFVQLNTRYVRLTAFDIVVAQVEAATGESLRGLVQSLEGVVPEVGKYVEPSDLVLSVFALLQNHPPSQRGYLNLAFEDVVRDWPLVVVGTGQLVEFLKQEMVFDWDRLPTESVLAPLVALWAQAPETPDERGNVRILLRKYLWRAFFTTRYDRAVPTAVLQDYRALKRVLAGAATESEILCLDEERYPLPNREMLLQARWPKYRDRLARAMLLLSLRGGAEDIADGATLSPANIQGREYHHLYPAAWLKDNGFDEGEANRALNCALVTWRTNRRISAKEPVMYLLERCEPSHLGEPEIRRRLRTHFVDFDSLASGEYVNFLNKRAEDYGRAMRSLCEGEAWRP